LVDSLDHLYRWNVSEVVVPCAHHLHSLGAALAFEQLDIQSFGLIVALVPGHEERRELALRRPVEAHRDLLSPRRTTTTAPGGLCACRQQRRCQATPDHRQTSTQKCPPIGADGP